MDAQNNDTMRLLLRTRVHAVGVFTYMALMPSFLTGQQPEWRFDLEPTFEIGGSLTDPKDQLGSVSDVARLASGEVAILDAMIPAIRIYDGRGQHLRDIGRLGDGPGEFRQPTAIAAVGDTIFVLDEVGRRTGFHKGGDLLFTERFVIEPLCGEEHNAGYDRLLPDGSVIIRCNERLFGRVRGEYRQEVGLLRVRPGTRVDTIGWFPADSGRTDSEGVPVPRPYIPRTYLLWAAGGQRIHVAPSEDSVITVLGFDGTVLGTNSADVRPRTVSEGDVQDELEELLRFVVSENDKRVIREWFSGRPLAEETPAIRSLLASSVGEVWVETWGPRERGSEWHVIGRGGETIAHVRAPPGAELVAVGERWGLALWRDAFEVDRVRLYRLTRVGASLLP